MTPSKPAPAAPHRSRALAAVSFVVAAVALIAAFGPRRSDPAAQHTGRSMRTTTAFASDASHPPEPPQAADPLTGGAADDGELGEEDGVLPDGITVFRNDLAAVANLDPALLAALRAAATDAADDGVEFTIHSAWRSRAYQGQLLRDAVDEYGSAAEAARWVAPPDRSAHVSGDAIDLESGAARWLARHGAAYGLCQIYDNEEWHYELRPDAVEHSCPARYADAAHDPRMQP